MNLNNKKLILILPMLYSLEVHSLNYKEAFEMAIEKDYILKGLENKANRYNELSQSELTWSDPKFSMSIDNGRGLFNENSPKLKLGITQEIPLGDTLNLKSKKKRIEREEVYNKIQDRKLLINKEISFYWLEVYKYQEIIKIINKNKNLFLEVQKIEKSKISNRYKKNNYSNLINAQLEITKLENEILTYNNKLKISIENIKRLLGKKELSDLNVSINDFEIYFNEKNNINNHPKIKQMTSQIKYNQINTKIEKEKYKPKFTFNANYTDKYEESKGEDFSFGITVQVPINKRMRQDKWVRASIYNTEFSKNERDFVLQNWNYEIEKNKLDYKIIKDQIDLYEKKLLPKLEDKIDFSLKSYINDEISFEKVVNNNIEILDNKIAILELKEKLFKSNINLRYLYYN